MKRRHIHLAVDNLETSIGFYSAFFGSQPTSGSPITPSGCSIIRASISSSLPVAPNRV
jgi:hypothetical protein